MDWLTFIVQLTGVLLGWSVVALVLGLVARFHHRQPLDRLIDRLKNVKWPGGEAEFTHRLDDAEASVAKPVEDPPAEVVKQAWQRIDEFIKDYATKYGVTGE